LAAETLRQLASRHGHALTPEEGREYGIIDRVIAHH
jgi:hypothetical protein